MRWGCAIALCIGVAACAPSFERRVDVAADGVRCIVPEHGPVATVEIGTDGVIAHPPDSLVRRGGYLACRAFQTRRITRAAYASALRDGARAAVLARRDRALAALLGPAAPDRLWYRGSAFLAAACRGLRDDRPLDAAAALFCAQVFSDQTLTTF